MKLITVPPSPFARKVRVVIHEAGLNDRVEVSVDNPWSADTRVPDVNPIGKVPVLILDDGTALYDSSVICEYLDSCSVDVELYPAAGAERWAALRQQRMADQMVDAFVLRRLEGNRPEERQHAPWVERQWAVVQRCLDAAESEASTFDANKPTIGTIAMAAALGHLDFRRGDDPDWRVNRPALAAWYEAFSARPSMQATWPQD